MLRNLKKLLFVVAAMSLLGLSKAQAAKFVVSGGAFSFSAVNASNRVSATISGLGSYQLAYRHVVDQTFELDLGYSMLATNTISGDLSFGFDLGANYYFLTGAAGILVENDAAVVVLNDRWRPFVGVSFNQRSFQSTASQYSGFGLKGGTEYQFDERFAIHGTIRYLMLGGPSQSSATQIDILSGIVVQF